MTKRNQTKTTCFSRFPQPWQYAQNKKKIANPYSHNLTLHKQTKRSRLQRLQTNIRRSNMQITPKIGSDLHRAPAPQTEILISHKKRNMPLLQETPAKFHCDIKGSNENNKQTATLATRTQTMKNNTTATMPSQPNNSKIPYTSNCLHQKQNHIITQRYYEMKITIAHNQVHFSKIQCNLILQIQL